MTGYEKIMSMTLEELANTEICPCDLGLEDDEELCKNISNIEETCVECLKRALNMDVG